MTTLYASYTDASSAERAAGALLDQGAASVDISIVAATASQTNIADMSDSKAIRAEEGAKTGLSTTTSNDAAIGAAKGAGIGVGVATLAVLSSMLVPGLGLVIGGGALAIALAGGAATVVAGGIAGGVYGYLRDQGIPEEEATEYNSHFLRGGAILEVCVPTGSLTSGQVEGILSKYGARNVAAFTTSRTTVSDLQPEPPDMPFRTFEPTSLPPVSASEVAAASTRVKRVIEASTGESRIVADVPGHISVDPVTGEVSVTERKLVVRDEQPINEEKLDKVQPY